MIDAAEVTTPAFQELIDNMFQTMYDAPGIGLAATQVDVHKRFMVIDETRVARIEIHGMQAAMEVHGGTGLFGQFQQRGVQIAAMDRPDH
ncbi:peptide deformylase, partial [Stenotrophomonas sp. 3diitr2024]|uniref:peptide deformylase n=1 Tax=Stenotrophomonas sp. 3diitr2024 TaxID=3345115 RepID=UPI0035CB9C6F